MNNNEIINELQQKIENIFLGFGFDKELIHGNINYKYRDTYRKVSFVQDLGFVIEFAETFEDALKNLYEDGDCYPLSLGENLVDVLKEDIIKYMI